MRGRATNGLFLLGLALLCAGLGLAWLPLGVMAVGVALCFVAILLHLETQPAKPGGEGK